MTRHSGAPRLIYLFLIFLVYCLLVFSYFMYCSSLICATVKMVKLNQYINIQLYVTSLSQSASEFEIRVCQCIFFKTSFNCFNFILVSIYELQKQYELFPSLRFYYFKLFAFLYIRNL